MNKEDIIQRLKENKSEPEKKVSRQEKIFKEL